MDIGMKNYNKQQEIEKYLIEPIEEGDRVYVRGLGIQNKQKWGNIVEVLEVFKNGDIEVVGYNQRSPLKIPKEGYKKYTDDIGVDPIIDKPWNSSLRIIGFSLDSILHSVGYDRRQSTFKTEKFGEVTVEELNWDPFLINKEGEEIYYQRDFVWTLKDKQLLIESIYNSIDIGKIVIRKRAYSWVENRIKSGKKAYFKDIVDGKQRLNAIIGFLNNEFPDLRGYYWKDFSEVAKRRFGSFSSVSYGELGEYATDEDVKSVFLGVNFSGIQMSEEHINFVKNIKL